MLAKYDLELGKLQQRDLLKREEIYGKKASCISSFTVANSVEEIASFMMYAAGNIDMSVLSRGATPGESKIVDAWIGKMEQMYHMASISFPSSSIYPTIEKMYKEKKEEIIKAKKKNKASTFGGLGVCFGLLFLPLIILGISNKVQEAKMEKIVQEVETDISEGDYEKALLKAQSIHLDSSWSSQDDAKYWDRRREELIDLIEEKMEEESNGGI